MPGWLSAGGWGLLAGGALVAGALFGYLVRVPQPVIAAIMAFGSGVLISAVAFDLIADANERGGLLPTAVGAVAGALAYTLANVALARRGARHRKRSGTQQAKETDRPGSGAAIALGALLDGIPESIVIGTSLLGGGPVSAATVMAVFVSNVPEGLSSAAGMRRAGRGRAYVFGLWTAIALASGLAAAAGYAFLGDAPAELLAAITALAAGAILSMIADTMIPEAFEDARLWTGLIAVLGFLAAFAIAQWLARVGLVVLGDDAVGELPAGLDGEVVLLGPAADVAVAVAVVAGGDAGHAGRDGPRHVVAAQLGPELAVGGEAVAELVGVGPGEVHAVQIAVDAELDRLGRFAPVDVVEQRDHGLLRHGFAFLTGL
nr:hypothetical protein GCM10025732_52410 [Glycomyces mayteni]